MMQQRHASSAPPIVDDVLRTAGQPLDRATRATQHEPRFGHDFTSIPACAGKPGQPLAEEEFSEVAGGDDPPKPAPKPAAPAPAPAPPPATPPKLTKVDVSAATGASCGAYKWVIQWKLDKKTTKGGWVVQKVEYPHDVKTCDDKPYTVTKADGFDPAHYPFWEAWQINKDQDVTTYAETGDREDDTFASGPLDEKKGSRTKKGTAEFYDGLTLPASFKVTNKPPAFILPSTKTKPTLTGGTGAIDHSIKVTWNCCKDSKDRKSGVTAT